jgi:hypothetical protein
VRRIGIWIDHRKAVVVTIDQGTQAHRTIEADVGRHAKATGGWRTATPYGPQVPNEEHAREHRYMHHLVDFYKDVIKAIDGPDHLLIMGPAQAKDEFANEVRKTPTLRHVPLTVVAADKMSDARIVERVRKFEVPE